MHALLLKKPISTQANSIATTTTQDLPALPQAFFDRPAQVVASALIGSLLVKRQPDGDLLWGVIVEEETYSQEEPTWRCNSHWTSRT